jgi:hypothetical protein
MFRDGLLDMGEVNVKKLNKKSSSTAEVTDNKWLKRQILLLAVGALCCVALLFVFLFFTTIATTITDSTLGQTTKISITSNR